jgi:biotin transport system ATP-binding protein
MHHLQTKNASITLERVTLVRGSTVVLHDLSLTLNTRRIGLIGDNGAGKSSLFRLLCGLDLAQTGQVLMPRTETDRTAPLVGMMFQNPDEQIIFPTVEEELALSLRHLRLSRAETQTQVRAWLAARGLADWAPRAIGSLSQGQRQHVCWLALLIGAHQTLLLDEPFSSLDLPGQALLHKEIAAAPQQVIVSTHALNHVRHFERVIWLDKGHVRADGLGAEVCAQYEADVAARMA